jgi:integrase
LATAVKWKLIQANPADETDPPKIGKSKVRPLTAEEFSGLLAKVKGTQWEALILLYLMLGPRRGEALALQWRDVDLTAGTITFRRTLYRHDGKLRTGEVKTASSVREIPMPKVLHAALAGLYGGGEAADDLVFRTSKGTPLEPRNVYRKIHSLTGGSVHALRHTFATMLLGAKVPVQAVAGMLGHANPAITLRVYSHLMKGMLREAADVMDDLVGR